MHPVALILALPDFWKNSRDFIDTFQNESNKNVFVDSKTDLMNVSIDETDRLMGLFSQTHVPFDIERRNSSIEMLPDTPSISEMTRKAIEMLSKNQNEGFFLMVEGKDNIFDHEVRT